MKAKPKTRRVVLEGEFLAVIIHGSAYDFIAHTNIDQSGGGAALFYPYEKRAARHMASVQLDQFKTSIVRVTLRVSEPRRRKK